MEEAKSPNKSDDSNPEKTTVAKVKKCHFKGCKKTSLDGIIKNHACAEHEEVMKARSREKRKANYQQHVAFKRKDFNYALPKDVRIGNFMKELSWERDVIKVAAIGKGEMIGLSQSTNSFYDSLKKYGMAFLPEAVVINDNEYNKFVNICDKASDKFKQLWTSLTKQNTVKLRGPNQPERYSINSETLDEDFNSWNNIGNQFVAMSKEIGIPERARGKGEIDFDFTILKSDPGLDEPQDLHTDEFPDFKFGKQGKQFPINSITAVSKASLIYVQPMDWPITLVLLEQGDTILFRGDIPHAGAENLTDNTNYRIHGFWHVPNWTDSRGSGFTSKKSRDKKTFDSIKWNVKDGKFSVGK